MNQKLKDAGVQPNPSIGCEIGIIQFGIFAIGKVATVVYAILRYRNGRIEYDA